MSIGSYLGLSGESSNQDQGGYRLAARELPSSSLSNLVPFQTGDVYCEENSFSSSLFNYSSRYATTSSETRSFRQWNVLTPVGTYSSASLEVAPRQEENGAVFVATVIATLVVIQISLVVAPYAIAIGILYLVAKGVTAMRAGTIEP